MKLLLDIKENKAGFILELLHSFPYVKAKQLTPSQELFYKELGEAVREVKLVKSGRKKARKAEDFINEL